MLAHKSTTHCARSQEHQEHLEENGSRSSTPVNGKLVLGASTPVMRGGSGLQHPFQETRPNSQLEA